MSRFGHSTGARKRRARKFCDDNMCMVKAMTAVVNWNVLKNVQGDMYSCHLQCAQSLSDQNFSDFVFLPANL